MPKKVLSYTTTPILENLDCDVVDNQELFLDLVTDVSNIEYASMMTEEKVAALQTEQRRALAGLTVGFA